MNLATVSHYLADAITAATVWAFACGAVAAVVFVCCFEIADAARAPHQPPAPDAAPRGRHEETRPRYDATR